ncbi:hypothetical protein [Pseudomonas batumici]|uniref:Uncharacterized protein n=1 Tax=Pseudomonas batumici TaxID=226910 RepID=A0A0C2E9B6_9PSED|nr:hypothetical protein [Pseudomonas batumici]KIH82474.1 hypothetical protein UCMB321_3770 [Pseudomonas batumici]
MIKKITPDPPSLPVNPTGEDKATFIRQSINAIFSRLDSEPPANEVLNPSTAEINLRTPFEADHSKIPSLLAIREDIGLQNVLANVSQMLEAAEYTADDINLGNNETARHQLFAVMQSVEVARTTVDSLLMLALETQT